MNCPICTNVNLLMMMRSNIEIDYCPNCRGVWLDRGELEKLIELNSVNNARHQQPNSHSTERNQGYNQQPNNNYNQNNSQSNSQYNQHSGHSGNNDNNNYNNNHHKKHKKEGWFGEIFDFD